MLHFNCFVHTADDQEFKMDFRKWSQHDVFIYPLSSFVGLKIRMDKNCKHLIESASSDMWRFGAQFTSDNYTFDIVNLNVYFGSVVTSNNDVSLKVKDRITLANRCYYGLGR